MSGASSTYRRDDLRPPCVNPCERGPARLARSAAWRAIPRLRRCTRLLIFEPASGDDLVQTTLERALNHWRLFDPKREPDIGLQLGLRSPGRSPESGCRRWSSRATARGWRRRRPSRQRGSRPLKNHRRTRFTAAIRSSHATQCAGGAATADAGRARRRGPVHTTRRGRDGPPKRAHQGAARRPHSCAGQRCNAEWPVSAGLPEGLGPPRPHAALRILAGCPTRCALRLACDLCGLNATPSRGVSRPLPGRQHAAPQRGGRAPCSSRSGPGRSALGNGETGSTPEDCGQGPAPGGRATGATRPGGRWHLPPTASRARDVVRSTSVPARGLPEPRPRHARRCAHISHCWRREPLADLPPTP